MGKWFRPLPPFLYMVQTILMGIWISIFLFPIANLGLLNSPRSFFIVLGALTVSMWVRSLLFRFGVAFMITSIYMDVYFRPTYYGWFQGIIFIFRADFHDVPALLHGNIPLDPLSTHLFLLILVNLYWLVMYAAARRRLWVLYSVLGISMLMLIDGNTNVHPNREMVGVLAIGAFNLGILQFRSVTYHRSHARSHSYQFFLPLVVLMSLTGLIAFFLPKYAAAWANPLTGVGSGTDSGRDAPVQMIGYQSNDSRLGGSFFMDTTPVLNVVENRPSYLRGECLATYTGKGWVTVDLGNKSGAFEYEDIQGDFTPLSSFAFYNLPTKPIHQEIRVLSSKLNTNNLLTGWAPTRIDSMSGILENATLSMDLVQGNIKAPQTNAGESYVVETAQLVNPYTILAESKIPFTRLRANLELGNLMEYYTQLPRNLPNRVHTLAQQIVGNASNEYDMVNRIESYLKENYLYATDGVPVPEKNQDYVDQFLFESKEGYCNNFSSSMAVMLRTLGVPTRWVTGFTSGEQVEDNGLLHSYMIRESDAHSWVEVYFPDHGWIPFDPTPNFNMDFIPGSNTTTGNNGISEVTPNKPKIHLPNQPDLQAGSISGAKQLQMYRMKKGLFIVLMNLLVLIVGSAWLLRDCIAVIYMKRIWRERQGIQTPAGPIAYLIHLLKRKRMINQRAVTLRDLHDAAKKCDVGKQEYKQFVKIIEDDWYGGVQPSSEDTKQIMKIWYLWMRFARKKRE